MTEQKQHRSLIILVLLFGLILRLGLAYFMRDSFLQRGNRSSSLVLIADNLINNHEFSLKKGDPTAVNEPLYAMFVALSFFIFGKTWLGFALAQSGISLLNALLIYKISLNIFADIKVAMVSLILFCFYPFYVTQSITISDTVLFCFLLGLSTYTTILAAQKNRITLIILCGVCWGLTVLTRLSALSLFPAALIYFVQRTSKSTRWTGTFSMLFVGLLMLVPWGYRNYLYTGQFFLTSHGAVEFWCAYNVNTLEIIKKDLSVDILKLDLKKTIPELRELEKKAYPYSIQREAAESKIFIKQALRFIQAHPIDSLKMMPLKLWKFWSWEKTPVSNSLDKERSVLSLIWDAIYPFYYGPLFFLSMLGLYMSRKWWRQYSVLFLYLIFYTIFHACVYGFTRLRVPLDQFLMIFASFLLVRVSGLIKKDTYSAPVPEI